MFGSSRLRSLGIEKEVAAAVAATRKALSPVWRRVSQPVWSGRAAEELLVAAELLYLVRPVVYCLMLRRYELLLCLPPF